MKILLTLFFSCLIILVFSQKGFDSEIEAKYELNYKLKNTKDAPTEQTNFILLANKSESYFKSMNVYVGDSLLYFKKIKETGNLEVDSKTFWNYSSDFMENIGVTSGKIYFSSENNYQYEEPNNISWTLKKEFKRIGNLNCQRAETVKYGRKWTAYFCADIPFPFGPYKFNKLPGLIIEIFDDKDDYHYKLYSLKKRKSTCSFANYYVKAKKVEKKKVFNYKRNLLANTSRFDQHIDDPEMLQKLKAKSAEKAKIFNPIELAID